jgi:hypothetical protein
MNDTDRKLTETLAQTIRRQNEQAKANGGCNGIISLATSPYKSTKICGLDGLCRVCASRSR